MPQPGRNASPGAFFDSDFSTIDSALAISLLYGMQGKSDCRVAIITVSRPNLAVTGFVDALERFYHGPAGNFAQVPPIGMNTAGAPGPTSPAFTAPFLKKKMDGTPVYKNGVKSVIDTGDPITLIRNYLEAQADHSAFLVLNIERDLTEERLRERLSALLRRYAPAPSLPSPVEEIFVEDDSQSARRHDASSRSGRDD